MEVGYENTQIALGITQNDLTEANNLISKLQEMLLEKEDEIDLLKAKGNEANSGKKAHLKLQN